ncbi:TraR/DksA C4-type zinc finger protein [bacterium]|nr:TraR/DksA C4-type zinc finger protein [bacterium]
MVFQNDLLDRSADEHDHLCPRQVLGVRMGMYAADLLGLELPQSEKRLYVLIESDGCFVDGVSAATGCTVGHRTMAVYDFGKIAATFVDTLTDRAIRISPHPEIRKVVAVYAPHVEDHWRQYLEAYQVIPFAEMFVSSPVHLTVSIEKLISREDARAKCEQCGEEIFNEREVGVDGKVFCRSCAGSAYYHALPLD